MKIRYKGIEHNNTTDAPFIGARICAIDCHRGCPNCFNQELRNRCYESIDCEKLLTMVQQNSLDCGIILGGLEWTEQPMEMIHLVVKAIERQMAVAIYTGMSQEQFEEDFSILTSLPIYVKFGSYKNELPPRYEAAFGVQLASENQYIVQYGS